MAEIISKTQVFNELTNEELEIVISFAATLIQSRDKNMEAKYLFSKFNKHIENDNVKEMAQKEEMSAERINEVISGLVGAIPDSDKSLEEYRAERLEKYEVFD